MPAVRRQRVAVRGLLAVDQRHHRGGDRRRRSGSASSPHRCRRSRGSGAGGGRSLRSSDHRHSRTSWSASCTHTTTSTLGSPRSCSAPGLAQDAAQIGGQGSDSGSRSCSHGSAPSSNGRYCSSSVCHASRSGRAWGSAAAASAALLALDAPSRCRCRRGRLRCAPHPRRRPLPRSRRQAVARRHLAPPRPSRPLAYAQRCPPKCAAAPRARLSLPNQASSSSTRSVNVRTCRCNATVSRWVRAAHHLLELRLSQAALDVCPLQFGVDPRLLDRLAVGPQEGWALDRVQQLA